MNFGCGVAPSHQAADSADPRRDGANRVLSSAGGGLAAPGPGTAARRPWNRRWSSAGRPGSGSGSWAQVKSSYTGIVLMPPGKAWSLAA